MMHLARRVSTHPTLVPACGAKLIKIEGRLSWFFDAVTCPECLEHVKAERVIAHMKAGK